MTGGSSVAVLGDRGTGRSVFLWRVTSAHSSGQLEALQLFGSEALRETPFAHLAALATKLPELALYPSDPLTALQQLGARAKRKPLCIAVDDAECVDPESAAVLAQLAGVGAVQLALAASDAEALPTGFRQFLARADTVTAFLPAIDEYDARTLLEGQLGQPVDASSVSRLLAEAHGIPSELARCAALALREGRLVRSRGYFVLAASRSFDDPAAPERTREQRLQEALSAYEAGDRARALELLEPLIALDDPDARLQAGRIEVVSGDADRGVRLLTPLAGDSELFRASSALWLAHSGQPYDWQRFEEWVVEESFPPGLRLRIVATSVVRECYQGDPARALDRAIQAMQSADWSACAAPDRAGLLYSVHLAILCEGSHELMYAPLFEDIDWVELDLDHGLFITSRAYTLAEHGKAAEALELAEQALALTQLGDAHGITGFVAAVGAGVAAMLEDSDRAREMLALYRGSLAHSGQLLRPEAERFVLGAVAAVESADAARAEYEGLRARAVEAGRSYVVMRLDHEAWRLGLSDSLEALAASAEGVTGQLADSLRMLGDESLLEEVASSQHAHGRTLFAAEFLADGARVERLAGNRVRAQALLALAAELADALPGVNTPRLARVRVDPDLLTARETDVCVRAASGLTNTEIADELFLSPRTVEGHLQRAYAKLGVSDRRQLLPHPIA